MNTVVMGIVITTVQDVESIKVNGSTVRQAFMYSRRFAPLKPLMSKVIILFIQVVSAILPDKHIGNLRKTEMGLVFGNVNRHLSIEGI